VSQLPSTVRCQLRDILSKHLSIPADSCCLNGLSGDGLFAALAVTHLQLNESATPELTRTHQQLVADCVQWVSKVRLVDGPACPAVKSIDLAIKQMVQTVGAPVVVSDD